MNTEENSTPNSPQTSNELQSTNGQQLATPEVGTPTSQPAPEYSEHVNVAQPFGPPPSPAVPIDDSISPQAPVAAPPVQPAAPTEGSASTPPQSGAVNTPVSGANPAALQPAAIDPGQTMGIIGLVMAFVFAPLGLLLSLIARHKSKKAGYKNVVALIGVILSVVSILLFVLFVMLTVASTVSLKENAQRVQQKNAQSQAQARQEAEQLKAEVENAQKQIDLPTTN